MIINILLIIFCYIDFSNSYSINLNSNYFNSNNFKSGLISGYNSNYFNSYNFNSGQVSGFNSNYFNSNSLNSFNFIQSYKNQNYFSNMITQIYSSHKSNKYLTIVHSDTLLFQSVNNHYSDKLSFSQNQYCNYLFEPSFSPTNEPTSQPTIEPIIEPTAQPTAQSTIQSTVQPTAGPTAQKSPVLRFSIILELSNLSSTFLEESVKNSILLANANSMNISIKYQRWKNTFLISNHRKLMYNLNVETETNVPLMGQYKDIKPLDLYNMLKTNFNNNINSGNYINLLNNALAYYNSSQFNNFVISNFIISEPLVVYPNKILINKSNDESFNNLIVLIVLIPLFLMFLFFIIKHNYTNIKDILNIPLVAQENYEIIDPKMIVITDT